MSEPITTLTDYALAGVACIFAGFLLRIGWLKRQVSVGCWGMAFGFVALAAALGGTCHGFSAQLGALGYDLWRAMIYSLSWASLMLLSGSVIGSSVRPYRNWLLLAALIKTLWLWGSSPHFEAAALDYMISLGIALLLQAWRPAAASPWLASGILTSGLALILLHGQPSVGGLTGADLYHLVQLIGLGLLYQGAKRLRDR
ncbi:MAG: hypothetical protein KME07_21145 [Pegethrix bostrychoides GSE-TBD4-15B]|jgi:lysylphosphatidylglycerol synthetase-like protein (DUF2156 family)|uniref:Uncharacterized protein n=1 Tax=Pegethrix bostrychoides GSE-TBD4-15B TaxID=2839662 RepID=A0A951U6R9_9CYAN|nr:hypothetical protein [Pegethrix bostrychoides GSE-TBD4-15B]